MLQSLVESISDLSYGSPASGVQDTNISVVETSGEDRCLVRVWRWILRGHRDVLKVDNTGVN